MHNVADVEVQKNIMDANKRLADRNKKNLEDKTPRQGTEEYNLF